MPLASFLGPLEAVTPAPAAAAPTSHSIGFTIEYQKQTNWCWAAVSLGVATRYNTPGWQQCTIASAVFPQCDCCGADGPRTGAGGCNNTSNLILSLGKVGHFDRIDIHPQAYETIKQEMNADRPLCCMIQWFGSNLSHYVVIGGWIEQGGTQYVEIHDPAAHAPIHMTYSDLCTRYSRYGDRWTNSYFTK